MFPSRLTFVTADWRSKEHLAMHSLFVFLIIESPGNSGRNAVLANFGKWVWYLLWNQSLWAQWKIYYLQRQKLWDAVGEHHRIAKELSWNKPVDKYFEHWKWREWKAKVPHLEYYIQSLIFWVTQQLPQKYIYTNTFYDMLIDQKHKTSQNHCGE